MVASHEERPEKAFARNVLSRPITTTEGQSPQHPISSFSIGHTGHVEHFNLTRHEPLQSHLWKAFGDYNQINKCAHLEKLLSIF